MSDCREELNDFAYMTGQIEMAVSMAESKGHKETVERVKEILEEHGHDQFLGDNQ